MRWNTAVLAFAPTTFVTSPRALRKNPVPPVTANVLRVPGPPKWNRPSTWTVPPWNVKVVSHSSVPLPTRLTGHAVPNAGADAAAMPGGTHVEEELASQAGSARGLVDGRTIRSRRPAQLDLDTDRHRLVQVPAPRGGVRPQPLPQPGRLAPIQDTVLASWSPSFWSFFRRRDWSPRRTYHPGQTSRVRVPYLLDGYALPPAVPAQLTDRRRHAKLEAFSVGDDLFDSRA